MTTLTKEEYINYDWAKLAAEIHKLNEKWWIDLETGERLERNKSQLMALVASEFSEALEGLRKNLNDDHLPHRKMVEVELADALIRILDYIGGFEVPLSRNIAFTKGTAEEVYEHIMTKGLDDDPGGAIWDLHTGLVVTFYAFFEEPRWLTLIDQIVAYSLKFDHDLMGALQEKLVYNQQRKDHSVEARKEATGKKF